MKKFWKQLKEKITSKVLTAIDLYSIVKYGTVLTREEMESKLIRDIDSTIQNKIAHNIFSTVIDLDTNDTSLINFIDNYYKERGFKTKILGIEPTSDIESPKLYIEWKSIMNQPSLMKI